MARNRTKDFPCATREEIQILLLLDQAEELIAAALLFSFRRFLEYNPTKASFKTLTVEFHKLKALEASRQTLKACIKTEEDRFYLEKR